MRIRKCNGKKKCKKLTKALRNRLMNGECEKTENLSVKCLCRKNNITGKEKVV